MSYATVEALAEQFALTTQARRDGRTGSTRESPVAPVTATPTPGTDTGSEGARGLPPNAGEARTARSSCRFHCAARGCTLHFSSLEAFDLHRAGGHAEGRYCLDPIDDARFVAKTQDGSCSIYADHPATGITVWTSARSLDGRRERLTSLRSPSPVNGATDAMSTEETIFADRKLRMPGGQH